MDPLLNDLREKQQSFRRTVVSLAAELKDARTRLASKEHSFAQETQARQEVERKARSMEDQILQLRKGLDEVNRQLQASTATSDQYLKELDDLKSKLSTTQATADANAELAQSAQLQCFALLTELDDKSNLLKEHEDHIEWLEMQLDLLQEDLQARETCEKQLRNEILAIEQEITQATDKARGSNSFELGRVLEEVSPKSLAKINKNLTAKDEQIAKLKEEIRNMSAHWKLKTKDLESQLEKHQKTDQELKKRVLKLEFCLQEARSQMRKLQRTGERKDKALKELTEQLAVKQQGGCAVNKQSFWESSGFKILISMSMLILVVFSKSWRNRSSSRVV